MDYYNNYLKYKNKYLNLKLQLGGSNSGSNSGSNRKKKPNKIMSGEKYVEGIDFKQKKGFKEKEIETIEDEDRMMYYELSDYIKKNNVVAFENELPNFNPIDEREYEMIVVNIFTLSDTFKYNITTKIIDFFIKLKNIAIDEIFLYTYLGDNNQKSNLLFKYILEKTSFDLINVPINFNSDYQYIDMLRPTYIDDKSKLKSSLYNIYDFGHRDKITLLYIACGLNYIDKVKILLDLGAEPNIPNDAGRLPLHKAVKNFNLELVNLLVPISNVNFADKYGKTPFMLLVAEYFNRNNMLYKQKPKHNFFDIFNVFLENSLSNEEINYFLKSINLRFIKYNILIKNKTIIKTVDKYFKLFNALIDKTNDTTILNNILIIVCNLNFISLYEKIISKIGGYTKVSLENKIDNCTCLTSINETIINDLINNCELNKEVINYNIYLNISTLIYVDENFAIEDNSRLESKFNKLIPIINLLLSKTDNFNFYDVEQSIPNHYDNGTIGFWDLINTVLDNYDIYKDTIITEQILNIPPEKIQKFLNNKDIGKKNYNYLIYLIENKMIDVNTKFCYINKGIYDLTLLHIVCINEDIQLIDKLLSLGANITLKDSTDKVPFDYLDEETLDSTIYSSNKLFDLIPQTIDTTYDYLKDPVTLVLFDDPYVASDGYTYSKSTLESLFSASRTPKSPFTREILIKINGNVGVENILVKQLVDKFKEGKTRIRTG